MKLDQHFVRQQVRTVIGRVRIPLTRQTIPVQHMGDPYDEEIAAQVKEDLRRKGLAVSITITGAGWLTIEAA